MTIPEAAKIVADEKADPTLREACALAVDQHDRMCRISTEDSEYINILRERVEYFRGRERVWIAWRKLSEGNK